MGLDVRCAWIPVISSACVGIHWAKQQTTEHARRSTSGPPQSSQELPPRNVICRFFRQLTDSLEHDSSPFYERGTDGTIDVNAVYGRDLCSSSHSPCL